MMKLFSQLSTDISIHALLAESDRCCPCAIIAPAISIHALLAESDAAIFFLYCAFPYFYPRSPCGERRFHFNAGQHICVISIHALLAESDLNFHHRRPCCFQFLSTLSLRRATCGAVWGRCAPQISIHALLAESDCFCLCHLPAPGNFYPRSPCGERRGCFARCHCWEYFYPRSPCGERPASDSLSDTSEIISIHALLAESDRAAYNKSMLLHLFLSTLSLRRATNNCSKNNIKERIFLSTLSLRRATIVLLLFAFT